MEWIKVKVKHFDYDFSDATDSVYKLWISAMIYTAVIEKMPTKEQLDRRLGREGHKNLSKYLQKTGVKLGYILGKVLEDVAVIKHKRGHSKEFMRTQRGGQQDDNRNAKIREDKIREDKSVSFDPEVCKMIEKTAKEKAMK